MSTRACYRFIDPEQKEADGQLLVVTVYKHGDGYPEGAVCWITKALGHAWALPRFEADEFAAAFVAANKPSGEQKADEYGGRASDLEAKAHDERLSGNAEKANELMSQAATCADMAKHYRPGGRYADMNGGGVRLVNKPGLDAYRQFATDIEYLYDVTLRKNQLHATVYSTCCKNWESAEADSSWSIKRVFTGSLEAMQAKYGLQYL